VVVTRPPAPQVDVSALIEEALETANAEGVAGQAVTPFVLSYLTSEAAARRWR
jgi:pseudouridine-5'-phosphate glycosidase